MPESVCSERSYASTTSSMWYGKAQNARPVRKVPRHDIHSGMVLHNPYKPEVMAALRSRGGPLWLRGKVEHMSGVDALGYNHGLYAAVKNLGNFDVNFNELFGLSPHEAQLNKTLINRLTLALEAVAVDLQDGRGRTLDRRLFCEACHQCGLGHLRPDVMDRMFGAIDNNGDSHIEFKEWLTLLDSVHPRSQRPSTRIDGHGLEVEGGPGQSQQVGQFAATNATNLSTGTNLRSTPNRDLGAKSRNIVDNYEVDTFEEEIIEEDIGAGGTAFMKKSERASSKSTVASDGLMQSKESGPSKASAESLVGGGRPVVQLGVA
mmetsp:Transcript_13970/g.34535  ORF Transcript_13970/g.34535 Transcript_13970/m.34535 type:complete len:319 (+) Transcript_13970:215-1171(+)